MPIVRTMSAWSIQAVGNPNIKLKKQPTEYLRQIYFDSLVFTPEALRHLAAQVGVGQIVLGSDYPFPWQLAPVDHIFASPRSATTTRSTSSPHRREAAQSGGVALNASTGRCRRSA